MSTATERAAPGATRCSRCGTELVCGALGGPRPCWCRELPPVEPAPGQTCLCPACLREKVDGLRRPM